MRLDNILFVLFFMGVFLFLNNMDQDYYMHLKIGELIAASREVPSTDPFSFTFFGSKWTAHEWLSDVMMYYVHGVAGDYGVKFLADMIVTLSIYITYRTSSRLSGNTVISFLMAITMFVIIQSFIHPRPHVFSYLFMAIYVHILISYKYHAEQAKLYLLPIIMVLWVNLHGSYLIGLAILILFALTEGLQRYLSLDSEGARLSPLKPLIIVALLCVLATAVNPYGLKHWLFPLDVLSLSALTEISEWKTPDFYQFRFQAYLLFVSVYLLASMLTRNRPSLTEAVVPLLFVAMGIKARRHIPIAMMVLVPFAAIAFSNFSIKAVLPNRAQLVFDYIKKTAGNSFTPAKRADGTSVMWFLLLSILSSGAYIHLITNKRIEYLEFDYMPVEAVEFIKNAGIRGNVYNSYNTGGYLINKLYPDTKVFIDGRLDMYESPHFYIHAIIERALDDWRKLLGEYSVDYVLIYNNAPLTHALKNSSEFKLIYRDRFYSIYLSNNEKFEPLFKKYMNYYIRT